MVKSVGFFEMLVVDAKGSTGGICVMWKTGVSLHQNEFNKNPITVEVSDAICNWLLVDFYGPSYATKKKKAWKNLTTLLESYHGPWVCLGNFNFTANDSDILGGSKGGSSATNYLKDLIIEFGAIDLGCSGSKFTWAKGRWSNSVIKRRLDRGIANISWRLAFPRDNIAHLSAIHSNHTPILLDANPDDNFTHRPFRFETSWVRDNGCYSVVEKAWIENVSGSAMVKLCKKQDATRDALTKWNKEVFGNCQNSINELLSKIAEVQNKPFSEQKSKWLIRSEVLWRQKSRDYGLNKGTRKPSFFISPPLSIGDKIELMLLSMMTGLG